MASRPSNTVVITTGVVAGVVVPVAVLGYLNRHRAKDVQTWASDTFGKAKSSTGALLQSVQSATTSTASRTSQAVQSACSSVSSSASTAYDKAASLLTPKSRKLQRVKSFPIVAEDLVEEVETKPKKGKKSATVLAVEAR